jgi:tetratricopeptide (TPR) repeat protein
MLGAHQQESAMSESSSGATALSFRRALAYWWYALAQTACYWGIRTAERTLFRWGIACFSRAIAARPEFAQAYYRRGLIRGRELSQHAEALSDLTRAIELVPEWPEPYLQRGLFQRFHGDQQAAIADLERYLALGGDVYWRLEAERQIRLMREESQE